MEMTAEEIQLWEEAMARGMEKERNEEEELQISTSPQEKESEKVSNTSTDEENDLVISADEDQEDPTPLNQKIHQLENELQKLAGVKAAKEDIENNYLALQDQFLELKRECITLKSNYDSIAEELEKWRSNSNSEIPVYQQEPQANVNISLPSQQKVIPRDNDLERSRASMKLQIVLMEAEKIKTSMERDEIKDKKAIGEMQSDMIKNILSGKGQASYKETLCHLEEFQLKLKSLQIEAGFGEYPISEQQRSTLAEEINKLELLKENVIRTNKDIQKEAENRNIRLMHAEGLDNKILDAATPKFSGNNSSSVHIYEWIQNMDSYLKFRGIPHEHSGVVLKEHIEGEAMNVLNNRFRNVMNPNPEEVKKYLVSYYGNRKSIIRATRIQHMNLGKLPGPSDYSQTKKCFTKTEQHLNLFNQILVLRKETPYDKQDESHPRNLDLSEYLETIASILPQEWNTAYRLQVRENRDHNNTTKIIEQLQKMLMDIKGIAFANMQDQALMMPTHAFKVYHEEDSDNETGSGSEGNCTESDEEDEKSKERNPCEICEHMEKNYDAEKYHEWQHAYREARSGRLFTRPESCPFLSNLKISDKRDFCESHEICRKCLVKSVDDAYHGGHSERTCTFLQDLPHFKCSEQGCPDRASMCENHQELNKERLQQIKNSLKREGCNFLF